MSKEPIPADAIAVTSIGAGQWVPFECYQKLWNDYQNKKEILSKVEEILLSTSSLKGYPPY
jgi:hypothetical protein